MWTVKRVAESLRRRSLDALEVCEECLRNAAAASKVNAFIKLTGDLARKQAAECSNRFRTGKINGILDGIPVAIKDNFNVEGIETTCASKMLQNFVSPYTATVAERMLDSGAVLIGKTNMDEFAMGSGSVDSIYGPVKNPWSFHALKTEKKSKVNDQDDFYICGGSSGGSAAAVAVGASLAALGSDTGGSTRSPAAMCGVVGLKPTYGLLSRYGLIPLVNSLDVPGIFALTVDDAAVILGVLACHDPNDSTSLESDFAPFELSDNPSVKGMRIGIPREYFTPQMSNDVANACQLASHLLEKGGAILKDVSLPTTAYSIACYSVINCCEVASNFARYDGIEYGFRAKNEESTESLFAETRHRGFNEVVRERILAGNYFLLKKNYKKYFVQAMKVRRLIAQEFEKVFNSDIDVLLTPVTLSEAPKYKEFKTKHNREQVALQDFCTQPVNMAGVPAISVPIRLSKNNLPLGVQLICNHLEEKRLLTVAKFIEREACFPRLKFCVE